MKALEVVELKKSFGKAEVLKGVSFSLDEGKVLSIIGSSGGGKTTLLRCLNFLEFAEEGVIRVDGETVYDGTLRKTMSESDLRALRLKFGLVFQQFNLFPQYNILKNVTLAPTLLKLDTPEAIEAKARDLIDRVGLSDKIDFYPCQLSGGQQQRAAIARALALDPKILCFDEPTSALDPELTGEVLKVIRELKEQGRTMVIVTHEMAFAREVSDRVIYLAKGQIAESGTPEEVFGNPQNEALRNFLRDYSNLE